MRLGRRRASRRRPPNSLSRTGKVSLPASAAERADGIQRTVVKVRVNGEMQSAGARTRDRLRLQVEGEVPAGSWHCDLGSNGTS